MSKQIDNQTSKKMSKQEKKEIKKYITPTIYKVLRPFLKFVFYFVFQPRVYGKENIPKEGGAVLAGNHIFVLDPFPVASGTKRCVHFLAKYELFKYKFTNWLFNQAGVIPVHRQTKDRAALDSAEEYIKAGALVAVFPETTIIKPEGVRVLPFKMGAVKMAYDTGCPIVPFTVNGKYLPIVGKINITFHEPFYVESDDLEAEREKLVQIVCGGLNPPLKEGERQYSK